MPSGGGLTMLLSITGGHLRPAKREQCSMTVSHGQNNGQWDRSERQSLKPGRKVSRRGKDRMSLQGCEGLAGTFAEVARLIQRTEKNPIPGRIITLKAGKYQC